MCSSDFEGAKSLSLNGKHLKKRGGARHRKKIGVQMLPGWVGVGWGGWKMVGGVWGVALGAKTDAGRKSQSFGRKETRLGRSQGENRVVPKRRRGRETYQKRGC